jgi:hypothetical protein
MTGQQAIPRLIENISLWHCTMIEAEALEQQATSAVTRNILA